MYSGLYHPFMKNHGPFSFFKCEDCGSGLTFPLPTREQIEQLYASFSGGLIPSIKKIRENNPLTTWYQQCIKRATARLPIGATTAFAWLDVGAGSGELSFLLSEQFPLSTGTSVDFHDEPPLLSNRERIRWVNADLDSEYSLNSNGVEEKYDAIFLITVLEHVRQPNLVVGSLLKKMKPGGCLYITVPDFGSWAASMMGKRWPYFLPGEHLYIPTIKGMKKMLKRLCEQHLSEGCTAIDVNATVLPYSLGYYLSYFGVKRFPSALAEIPLRLPTGILEAAVISRKL